METNDVELVGAPCAYYGPYTFYKAFKFRKNGQVRIIALSEFFFVKLWSDSDLVSIGELQLLWLDKNSDQMLASLRLYFLPENTPDGRADHGEDEVLAISEKVVLRVEDLLNWITLETDWSWGMTSYWNRYVPSPPPFVQNHIKADNNHHTTTATDLMWPDDHNSNSNDPLALHDVKYESKDPLATESTRPFVCTRRIVPAFKDSLIDFSDIEKERGLLDDSWTKSPSVVVLSFPKYCRYRALMKRLETVEDKWLKHSLIAALGGFTTLCRDTHVLFCKDTFDYPDLEGHEMLCNHLAPRLKLRPRGKRKKRSLSPGGSESNESESSVSINNVAKSRLTTTGGRNGLRCNITTSSPTRRSSRTVHSAEEKDFLIKLNRHMKVHRTPIGRIPSLGCKEIDLYKFYTKVQRLGGYDKVSSNKLWKNVFNDLGGTLQNSSNAASITRRHYERLILSYERSTNGEKHSTPSERRKLIKSKSMDVTGTESKENSPNINDRRVFSQSPSRLNELSTLNLMSSTTPTATSPLSNKIFTVPDKFVRVDSGKTASLRSIRVKPERTLKQDLSNKMSSPLNSLNETINRLTGDAITNGDSQLNVVVSDDKFTSSTSIVNTSCNVVASNQSNNDSSKTENVENDSLITALKNTNVNNNVIKVNGDSGKVPSRALNGEILNCSKQPNSTESSVVTPISPPSHTMSMHEAPDADDVAGTTANAVLVANENIGLMSSTTPPLASNTENNTLPDNCSSLTNGVDAVVTNGSAENDTVNQRISSASGNLPTMPNLNDTIAFINGSLNYVTNFKQNLLDGSLARTKSDEASRPTFAQAMPQILNADAPIVIDDDTEDKDVEDYSTSRCATVDMTTSDNVSTIDDDREGVEFVPNKPKTPDEVIVLVDDDDDDEVQPSPSPVNRSPVNEFKKRKLDILKEGGLEVTPVSSKNGTTTANLTGNRTRALISINKNLFPRRELSPPDAFIRTMRSTSAELSSPGLTPSDSTPTANITPPTPPSMPYFNAKMPLGTQQPPKVIQSRSIYSHSEKIVYGNPKDPFMSRLPPHVLTSRPPPVVQIPKPDILDLTKKSPTPVAAHQQKPVVEIMRVPPPSVPSSNNLSRPNCHRDFSSPNKTTRTNERSERNERTADYSSSRLSSGARSPPLPSSTLSMLDGRVQVGSNLEITLVSGPKSTSSSTSSNKVSTHGPSHVRSNNSVNHHNSSNNSSHRQSHKRNSLGKQIPNVMPTSATARHSTGSMGSNSARHSDKLNYLSHSPKYGKFGAAPNTSGNFIIPSPGSGVTTDSLGINSSRPSSSKSAENDSQKLKPNTSNNSTSSTSSAATSPFLNAVAAASMLPNYLSQLPFANKSQYMPMIDPSLYYNAVLQGALYGNMLQLPNQNAASTVTTPTSSSISSAMPPSIFPSYDLKNLEKLLPLGGNQMRFPFLPPALLQDGNLSAINSLLGSTAANNGSKN